ncbi:hypothetical protein CROQUDRAFT_41741, partial [Cronartium quercuum f. sp. fusiforme G11]
VKQHLQSEVCVRTISHWHQLYELTLAVVWNVSEYEKCRWISWLTFDLIQANLTLYLNELWELMYKNTGIYISLSTISDNLIRHLNLTQIKVQKVLTDNRRLS